MAMNLVQFAQQLKEQVSLEELIRDYVPELKRQGKTCKARCPFHNEKTPSFHVNDEFGFYHCFGCPARGDAFSFVQNFEKVDFRMSVEIVAGRFGVPLPEFTGQRSSEDRDAAAEQKQLLVALCDLAKNYFVDRLWDSQSGKPARDYLIKRGLTEEQIRGYGLGLAPDSFDAFIKEADRHGYPPERAAEAGLIIARDQGGFYDRFRNRIIFPIADHFGKTIAFGGRLIDGEGPKYLNSPDTDIFHKGQVLYGLHAARDAIRQSGKIILLEGYMDWIALHSKGVENAVAGMGTALGQDQARLIGRFSKNVIIHYDGDEAGQKATNRASEIMLAESIDVHVVNLPQGEDPDSFIQSGGKSATLELLENAHPAIEYFTDKSFAEYPAPSPQEKLQIVQSLAHLLRAITHPVLREAHIRSLASKLGLSSAAIEQELRQRRRPEPVKNQPLEVSFGGTDEKNLSSFNRLECCLLRHLLYLLRAEDQIDFVLSVSPEYFLDSEMKEVFSVVCEAAKDIREGARPITDPLILCSDMRMTQKFDYILTIEGLVAAGEMKTPNRYDTREAVLEDCRILLSRLKRRYHKHLRQNDCGLLRQNRPTKEGLNDYFDSIHLNSQRVDSESRFISTGDAD